MAISPAPGRFAGLRLGLVAALCGAGLAAGQAPFGYWWLAVPALAALIWLVAAPATARATLAVGFFGGAGYGAAALFWIVEPFLVDAERHGWMAPFALLLMASGMGVFWALAALCAPVYAPGPALSPARALSRRRIRALGFALGLVATELLRGYAFTGFPWALIGHVWIGTPVMQAAFLVGPFGLTLLTLAAAVLPVLGAAPGQRLALAGLSVLLVAVVWGAGLARLAQPLADRAPQIAVRLVQPNAAQNLKWQPEMWRVFLDRQMAATAAPSAVPLDLIVWAETAVPFLLEDAGGFLAGLPVASGGVSVALGIQRSEGLRYYNSLVVVDGQGRIAGLYDKAHLVPFGEYIPFGDKLSGLGLGAFAAREGFGYSAGPGPDVLDLGRAGKVLPLICYEAVFPQDLARAPERADWILQVTNDGWFGQLAGPYQHLAQARLRAVEQGLPLLRAANTGVTAIIDARGQVVRDLALNAEGFVDGLVPAALAPTPYARTGDIPVTILVGCGFLALFRARRRTRD